ncbi:MAG: YfhO family protein [Nitrospirota bacterium]
MTEHIRGKIKWVRSINFLSLIALFFSSILFFYDLFKGRYLLAERDLGPYFIPPRFFWVESIKNGDFPLWNPYQFSGQPFFANPQHAILYPLNSLFFILPFDVAFNSIIILHFFLGGLFTYIFLKDLKVSSTGALISGLIFMLSGYLLSVHSLLSCLFSVIWTPLIMMFFRRAIAYPGFKNKVFTAIFLTISFLGGGVEIVYGIFFILFFMVIFSFESPSPHPSPPFTNPPHPPLSKGGIKGGLRPILTRFRSLMIVSIIFLFLSAVQLVPFIELLYHSIRRGGISYQEATIWSFAPKDVLLFFLPDAYGYFLDMKKYWVTQCWLKTLYTGGLPFILSSIFFIFCKGRKLFFSLMLFSVFLSLGHYTPLYAFVFKYVPFFNGIRYPVKFLYIFILVLAITAGLGFERLKTFSEKGEAKKLKIIFTVFSLICAFFLLFLVLGNKEIEHFMKINGIDFPNFYYASVNLYNIKRFFFYLTLFFLLLRVGHEVKWKGWIKVLLIVVLTADLFGNMGFYGKEKTSDYFQKTKVLEIISSDKEQFRTFSTSRTISMDIPILIGDGTYINYLKEKHLPSMNLLYKLHDIWGIDVIHLKRTDDLYRALIDTPSISATNIIDLMSVKYVISVTIIEKDPRFELIYSRLEGIQGKKEALLKENTIKLYRNKDPLPRGWLVKDFKIMAPDAILSALKREGFNPAREVFLEEKPKFNPSSPPFSKGGLGGKVELKHESNNRLLLVAESTENTMLVLSDTYFPGWKVLIDGKEENIYRADYNLRAVLLGAGTHQVKFIYDPLSFKLGAIITFLGIIGCLVIGLAVRHRKH